jgi:uncharacterized membrane protein YozB (DUF420 family)
LRGNGILYNDPFARTLSRDDRVLTAANIILALKIAVVAVTCLLVASVTALVRGQYRLHGRINLAFFTLTLAALLGLEVVAHLIQPSPLREYLSDETTLQALRVHLGFAVPAAVIMPAMLYTGLTHRRGIHLTLAVLFAGLWTGAFITGIFFLPAGGP